MKQLIREMMRREGKKSQVKRGDMLEVFRTFAFMLNDPFMAEMKAEWEVYLAQKNEELEKHRHTDCHKHRGRYPRSKTAVKKSKALGERSE